MSEELKPCPNPWCNSHKTTDAEIRSFEVPIVEPSRSSFERRVSCPCCPISGPWADTETMAIAAWNTRSTEATLRAENELMREALLAIRTNICGYNCHNADDAFKTLQLFNSEIQRMDGLARNALTQVAK